MERFARLLRDNRKTRWWMLLIISFVMFAAYIASDNIFSVEKTLMDPSAYGVTQVEYDNLAGAYSIFNVYLLMLIFGGLILDKMIGMLTGSLFDLRSAVQAGETTGYMNFLGSRLRTPVFWAVMGIGVYGAGAEIAGITATKAIAKWFIGYEMALAMGLQLALARLGTGIAYGATPAIVKAAGGNVGIAVLIGLVLLCIGLVAFLFYCIYDRKLDRQIKEAGIKENTSSPEDEFHFKDILLVFKNPAFWMIAFLCLLFFCMFPYIPEAWIYLPEKLLRSWKPVLWKPA